ncbi:Uncharacterized ABC transporter, ATP-binding protein and DUF4162 [Desulfonema limicola]|uniref:Uncharacterized ABC transporter, ATP-binding protein and DUF4162 n=1 Tax=Desulfonema limicola TaxID=45656 RepID=A0A975BAM1_9BACT|nr:ABC transporter ATP-binding protein [Desulfonema limicola]QTA81908.1 Uncharacterized ABC transporter, ATP-binding protein and DUF4162 [Desulfonema limicola]
MTEPVIKIRGLSKTYRTNWKFKRFTALDNLDLDVGEGEILGFLGPNGAGKTTTFKLMLGLIYPDKGSIFFSGQDSKNINTRADIGFLPENPYFYSHLTAFESLDFYGRLFNISKKQRQNRIDELLLLVGLEHARNRQLRKFSRGMLQRVGIAQALINDPGLLILDEPMSGLDPMGRKEMRDIILSCRKKGKTVIFSSHILSDVEMICDRVAIIFGGKLQEIVHVNDILDRDIRNWEITVKGFTPELAAYSEKHGFDTIQTENRVLVKIDNEEQAKLFLKEMEKNNAALVSFGPKRDSLEDIFIKKAKQERA